MTTNKSHLTAIARKTLPKPTRWLIEQGHLRGGQRTLDFGCGKCHLINPPTWMNYDPAYMPMTLSAWQNYFDRILCTYVLCVLPAQERIEVLKEIQGLLYCEGIAYISVRNDRPKNGWGVSSRGTYQGRVRGMNLPIIYQCAQFRIYKMTKEDKI